VKRFVSLQYLNLSRLESLDGGSARRKAATYTGQHKHRINADRHPCLSGFRTDAPSVPASTVIRVLFTYQLFILNYNLDICRTDLSYSLGAS
jgi:hypothetical protein